MVLRCSIHTLRTGGIKTERALNGKRETGALEAWRQGPESCAGHGPRTETAQSESRTRREKRWRACGVRDEKDGADIRREKSAEIPSLYTKENNVSSAELSVQPLPSSLPVIRFPPPVSVRFLLLLLHHNMHPQPIVAPLPPALLRRHVCLALPLARPPAPPPLRAAL
eukprot:1539931-Rhodomonas_salina.1